MALSGYDRVKAAFNVMRGKAMPAPASDEVSGEESASTFNAKNLYNAYCTFEVVNRGVNLVADCMSTIPIDVAGAIEGYTPTSVSTVTGEQNRRVKKNRLNVLLNLAPNPDQSSAELWGQITVDFLLTGNAFLYFDGAYLYRLSPTAVTVHPGTTRLVDHYTYTPLGADIRFESYEVIHIKEHNSGNPLIGMSRLACAIDTLKIMSQMTTYQHNFFKNSALLGVTIVSKNLLSDKIKKRLLDSWMTGYNPVNGARKPIILDGDVDVKNVNQQTYRDLEFDAGYSSRELKILKAIGVPPILLEAGNNANISPNLKLFYMTTVLPLFSKIIKALERYFGYDLKPAIGEVPALLPEAKERADSLSTLANAGIITRNEARVELRYPLYKTPDSEEMADQLILPANIAGSAADKTQGGRPPNGSNQ